MDSLSCTSSSTITSISRKHTIKTPSFSNNGFTSVNIKSHTKILSLSTSLSSSISCTPSTTRTRATPTPTPVTSTRTDKNRCHHWMVLMDSPPQGVNSKPEIIDYYVRTLESVLGSEKDAQMCIYDASVDTHFGFCCDIDEEVSRELARLPGVLSVRPDPDYTSVKKDYSSSSTGLASSLQPQTGSTLLFPSGNTKHWLVRMDKPGVGVVTKAQMVDHYAQILTKVMGNEQDAQMCIYHVSWQSNFGFCCELDEECAQELAGDNVEDAVECSEAGQMIPVKTKKLFITGLSFYTSEKTLRAAFEGFGELVEVKIIMDKISKRSKGYGFVEYTTEEAASAALKEMNGKVRFQREALLSVAVCSIPP
ncbi:Organelle RRM domain-containing protein 1, chloroplastic [Turnera subulata]|uniref:Organelle RRM domain-containing protein 1, chloroplastic n=1 Tax=Turnera subulata TaxID=218843 RepID=A0A9Q0J7Z8_9ROSI|nr:Organelle RRM domain-containing protein 1, chloroplastic [Turnera subulata]